MKDLMPRLIDHFDLHVRKIVPRGVPVCLKLDGHSSLHGWDRLVSCREKNIEVIQSPANTSHFLQPCDSHIDKTFKTPIRTTVDYLTKFAIMDLGKIGMKRKLAISGYHSLTEDIVMRSFSDVGLCPMDYRVLKLLPGAVNRVSDVSAYHVGTSTSSSARSKRRSDRITVREVQDALEKDMQPSNNVGRILEIVRDHQKIGSSFEKYGMCHCSVVTEKGKQPALRTVLQLGTPDSYLTHGELVRGRQERQVAAAAEKDAKEEHKQQKREGRESKRLEKEKAKKMKKVRKVHFIGIQILNAMAAPSQELGCYDHSKRRSTALGARVASLDRPSNEEKDVGEALITLHGHDVDTPYYLLLPQMPPNCYE